MSMSSSETWTFWCLTAIGLVVCILAVSAIGTLPPRYKKLTMLQSDGTKKVFIGRGAGSSEGRAYWTDNQHKSHEFYGPHWLEQVSSQTYNDFKISAEQQ